MGQVPHIVPGTLNVSLSKVSISEPFSLASSCLFSLLMRNVHDEAVVWNGISGDLEKNQVAFPLAQLVSVFFENNINWHCLPTCLLQMC